MTEIEELQQRVATLEAIVGNIFVAADRANWPHEVLGASVKGPWEEARRLIEQSTGRPINPKQRWLRDGTRKLIEQVTGKPVESRRRWFRHD